MSICALVVDDDSQIVRTVGDILASHGHEHVAAGDMESARRFLEDQKFDYLILDLDLPVAPGRFSRRENGQNLLGWLRESEHQPELPVIVITGRGKDDVDFAVAVMKTGIGAYTNYLQKPLDGNKLDNAIKEALSGNGVAGDAEGSEVSELEPFSSEPRELIIFEDLITVCGVEVWRDCAQPDLRDALEMMAQRDKRNRYVRIRGTKLNKELGRCVSNPISKPIQRFRDTVAELMESRLGLACGKMDVIGPTSGGGYHFTDWMDVKLAGSLGPEEVDAETEGESQYEGFNERQSWVLEQIDSGSEICQRHVVANFKGRFNQSTIKRDLQKLREDRVIRTCNAGHYVRVDT